MAKLANQYKIFDDNIFMIITMVNLIWLSTVNFVGKWPR